MDKIYELMVKLGVPKELKGFELMHDALETIINTNQKLQMTEVYNVVAAKKNVSITRIERNVRVAIERTLWYGNKEAIQSIFGNDISHIKNAKWLYTIGFILQQNLVGGQKTHTQMICVDGYKAFNGTLKIIIPGQPNPVEITGDWLYRPDIHCWCGAGQQFHESRCEVL